MSKKPKISKHIRNRTQEWFRKAQHDLTFLENAPFDVDDPPTDTACRLAHMVAEYSLKGYLMLNKRKIIKSHQLDELLDACIEINKDMSFDALRDHCVDLTQYKTEITYPGPTPQEVHIDEAKSAIEKAQAVYSFVLKKARELGY